MNQITPPPKIEIIPSSAPFSEAQRSWLNGFFAGLLSDGPTPLSAEQGEEPVQPGALRFGERRARGDDLDLGRRRDLVHGDTSASASLRSVPPSWRSEERRA